MPKLNGLNLAKLCLIVVTALLAGNGQTAFAAKPASAESVIHNFAQVAPNIYRGAVPDTRALPLLKDMGINTIVDLRMHLSAREESEAHRLGMQWLHVPLGYFAPSDKQVQSLMCVLTDRSYGKIFLHCAQGADRTGTVVALYRILVQDWPLDKVYGEMRLHHFKPWWFALKERVETERERLDKAKLTQHEAPAESKPDFRRVLIDRSMQLAKSETETHDE